MSDLTKFSFLDFDQFLDFIETCDEISSWEVMIFRLTSSDGAYIDTNTRINDPLGYRDYLELSKLKQMIRQYYTTNGSLPITVEIKLRCPASYRKQIDPNGYFFDFYFSLYANNVLRYGILSYSESDMSLQSSPFSAWVIYVTTIIDNWKSDNGIDE